MTDLIAPFAFPFMQQAFAIGLIVAVPTALLSCLLVLKGWSLMGDALSHAVLPGIVLAYVAGLPLAIGAFGAGLACAGIAGFLDANSRIKSDTVLGVTFSAMFAAGLVLYTAIDTDVHLDHILFGDMLGTDRGDLIQSGLIALVVAVAIGTRGRDLLLHAFDPIQARAVGLPTRLLHYGLLALISLTIVAALQATGIILTIAMLIAPGATAFLLARSFGVMLGVAVAVSTTATLIGIYASFHLDSAPAPTIVLVLTAWFAIAFAISTRRGNESGLSADQPIADTGLVADQRG